MNLSAILCCVALKFFPIIKIFVKGGKLRKKIYFCESLLMLNVLYHE